MNKKNEYRASNSKDAFHDAAISKQCDISEFVKMLARIAAEKDYETLLKMSSDPYNGSKRKEPKL